jgi:hypothetical protein
MSASGRTGAMQSPRGLYCSCVHTGTRVQAPVRVHAQPQKLFIVLRYEHSSKDYFSRHSYAIWKTKTAPNSKTLAHIEFPTLNFGEGPMSVFEAHFKNFFDTTDHLNKRIFGKNVYYTDKIKISDDDSEIHGVLLISLHNIPDERLPREMLALLRQNAVAASVRWMHSEQMRRIFSPSLWQRWITGLKFSTQPESERIWDILNWDPDYFLGNYPWTKLFPKKEIR